MKNSIAKVDEKIVSKEINGWFNKSNFEEFWEENENIL